MKKLLFFVITVAVAGSIAMGCKKAPQAPEGEVAAEKEVMEKVAPKGGIAPDVISSSLGKSLCKRMVECAPGTMTEDECVSQTTASLDEAQKGNPIAVAQAQLDTCIASIEKGGCEEVLGTEPPKGCEFLK